MALPFGPFLQCPGAREGPAAAPRRGSPGQQPAAGGAEEAGDAGGAGAEAAEASAAADEGTSWTRGLGGRAFLASSSLAVLPCPLLACASGPMFDKSNKCTAHPCSGFQPTSQDWSSLSPLPGSSAALPIS